MISHKDKEQPFGQMEQSTLEKVTRMVLMVKELSFMQMETNTLENGVTVCLVVKELTHG